MAAFLPNAAHPGTGEVPVPGWPTGSSLRWTGAVAAAAAVRVWRTKATKPAPNRARLLTGTLLLISALNRPFTGLIPISHRPFQHAVLNFTALDLTVDR